MFSPTRVGEEERLLEHERDRARAALAGRPRVRSMPPTATTPAVGSIEAGEQIAQRALARAGRADERDDLARLRP